MKSILTTLAVIGLSASAFAGCGKTETTSGKLKSVDSDSKSIVIEAGGKDVKLTLTAAVKDADKLLGKKVTAVSSHKKVESLKEGWSRFEVIASPARPGGEPSGLFHARASRLIFVSTFVAEIAWNKAFE